MAIDGGAFGFDRVRLIFFVADYPNQSSPLPERDKAQPKRKRRRYQSHRFVDHIQEGPDSHWRYHRFSSDVAHLSNVSKTLGGHDEEQQTSSKPKENMFREQTRVLCVRGNPAIVQSMLHF